MYGYLKYQLGKCIHWYYKYQLKGHSHEKIPRFFWFDPAENNKWKYLQYASSQTIT